MRENLVNKSSYFHMIYLEYNVNVAYATLFYI